MSSPGARRSRVSVVGARGRVLDAVREAMELAGLLDLVTRGDRLAVKPNLGFDLFYPGAVTSPRVLEGVLRVLRDRGADVVVVESDQVLVDIELAARRAGHERMLRDLGVPFVNMTKGEFVEVPVPGARHLATITVPAILRERDFVTVPVMKTHDKTLVSGAVKNQWGCLGVSRHNFHLSLDQVLSDLHKVLRPRFAVCDATVALEGDGPKTGRPRVVDRVLASSDPVALDALMARMMGFDPAGIGHLQLLTEDGTGTARDYDVVGEDVSQLNLRFARPRHNFVSVVELALRHSFLRRLVFETPLLDCMCWGAIAWYLIWYHVGPGARTRNKVVAETPYGEQWR